MKQVMLIVETDDHGFQVYRGRASHLASRVVDAERMDAPVVMDFELRVHIDEILLRKDAPYVEPEIPELGNDDV